MPEVRRAFVRREVIEECADASPSGLNGALFGLSDQGLELGEHHLDGIEVGAIGRQEQEVGAGGADGAADRSALVTAKVVEDDNISFRQCRDEGLLDPGGEAGPIDGAVQDQGSDNPVVTQAGQESQRLPVTVGNLGQVGLAARAPAACPGHVGFDPGLVEEDQALWVNLVLMGFPACPEARQLRSILLLRHQSFF